MKPGKCLDWIERIWEVDREHSVAAVASEILQVELRRKPHTLTIQGLEHADLDNYNQNLDSTYMIRMFAVFEAGLRDFWKSFRTTEARVSDMIRSIGSKRRIDDPVIQKVEIVRVYRNYLVHEESSKRPVVVVGVARGLLCTYFSRLPENW